MRVLLCGLVLLFLGPGIVSAQVNGDSTMSTQPCRLLRTTEVQRVLGRRVVSTEVRPIGHGHSCFFYGTGRPGVLLAELGLTELASDSMAAKYYANMLLAFRRDTAMAAQPEPLLGPDAMGYRWQGERERCVRLIRRRRAIVILHVYPVIGISDPSAKTQTLATRVVRRLS